MHMNKKYLSSFVRHTAYEAVQSTLPTPNVSWCIAENEVHYIPYYDPYMGHEYVDLGLPSGTLWATMNVGAETETDSGLYFLWGDTLGYTADQVGTTDGKKAFAWADYKWSDNGSSSTFTKYNGTDGKTVLDLEDDAVAANWGGEWKMPTAEQFQELSAAVDATWVTDYNGSGINGLKCVSKTDSSKVLFFPAVGFADPEKGVVRSIGIYGVYWSSSRGNENHQEVATHLDFFADGMGWSLNDNRCSGYPVRGVVTPPPAPTPQLMDYLFSDGTFGSEIGDKTPVGICVAPASHFEDGKARFMSLKEMSTASTEGTTSHEYIYWQNDSTYVDLPLTNYNTVITIDSNGNASGTQSYGYLPVDEKSGFDKPYNGKSYSQYAENGKYCPSPFLSDGKSKNDVYFTAGQALADIDGSSNTDVILTADNTNYLAAKACRSFNPGTHNGEWYLPAMGELGYVMVQWKAIDEAIVAANTDKSGSGVQLDGGNLYWSSTEYSDDDAWALGASYGVVGYRNKRGDGYVRAFLAL